MKSGIPSASFFTTGAERAAFQVDGPENRGSSDPMGLDSVEIVISWEEAFAISIRDIGIQ